LMVPQHQVAGRQAVGNPPIRGRFVRRSISAAIRPHEQSIEGSLFNVTGRRNCCRERSFTPAFLRRGQVRLQLTGSEKVRGSLIRLP
jgi:hypothetical protein